MAQELISLSDDQRVARNLHVDHVEWLRRCDAQTFSLADRVGMEALVLTKHPTIRIGDGAWRA
jgi:hypothetical protein